MTTVEALRSARIHELAGARRDMALLLSEGIDPQSIRRAIAAARHGGASPLDVLRTDGRFSEAVLTDALSSALGCASALSRSDLAAFEDCTIADPNEALRNGVLRLERDGEGDSVVLVAVCGDAVDRLAALLEQADFGLASRVVLVAAPVFAGFVRAQAREAIGAVAAEGPARTVPEMMVRAIHIAIGPVVLGVFVLIAILLVLPSVAALLIELALACIFLTMGCFRLFAMTTSRPASEHAGRISDAALPTYTILVALYREAGVLPDLIAALRRLDYPKEKLEIRLLLEEDDVATRMAAAILDLEAPFEVVVVPNMGARTKPKALNAGLLGARGELLVVFDAEDRPEPDQLRRAAARFRAAPPTLACLQAALAIDNAAPRWLARLFAIEYMANFDALLPALAHGRLPILLGGTSNHFRTETLRELGGWDPENVTEDADLGIRFARMGLDVETLSSTTHEEAPSRIWPWLRQRTRWMKGYMVTWAVHGREPIRLAKELGWTRAIAVQLLLLGIPLAAVAHLLIFAILPIQLALGGFLQGGSFAAFTHNVAVASLVLGYTGATGLMVVGLARRRRLDLLLWLFLLPAYWILLAVATLRAASQLGAKRSTWEKTEHGREARAPVTDGRAVPSRPRRGFASG